MLAPVAPALSDAQDLRTARQQQTQDFASDQALKQAQLTAQKLASQGEQQRITQGNAPSQIPGAKDYYDATQGSWMRPSLVNGEFKAVKIPGQAPADELKDATKGLTDAFKAMGIPVPPALVEDLGYRIFGGTGTFNPMAGFGTARPVTLKGPDGKPFGATFFNGHYLDDQGKEIPHPEIYQKPTSSNPYLDWKAQNPTGTVQQYEAMLGQTRVNTAGGPGSWTIAEGGDGSTVLYNSKTGETQQAPEGLHKSGYYAKNIAPLEAAKLNVQDYMNDGVFDGPGDLALQHAFFTATQPSAGFRMTKVQQDTLQFSRSWLGGVEAKMLHAQTGQWYTPEQRQQIASAALSAIADKEKSLQSQPLPSGVNPSNNGTAPRTAEDYLKSVGVH